MDEQRRRRFAQNEALFRSVNENIESMTQALVPEAGQTMSVVCECGIVDCTQLIPIAIGDYERTRADPTLFIVVPGHELPEVEEVVERHDAFTIVCKDKAEGRRVAIATDPRAD